MKNSGIIIFLFLIALLPVFFQAKHIMGLPAKNLPEPIGDDEEKLLMIRQNYFELIHRAAPGIDWRKIEQSNLEQNIRTRNAMRQNGVLSDTETFANSKIKGVWSERGSTTQAGSIVASDYDSVNNNLYVISAGGSLWQNQGLSVNNWHLINDDYVFSNTMLKVINKTAGGIRLLANINGAFSFSDDNGASFTPVNIVFPVAWIGNNVVQAVYVKGASNNIYLLCTIYDDVSASSRIALFRSTDEGATFNRFYTFNHSQSNQVKLLNPYNSSQLLVLDFASSTASIQISRVVGNTVTLLTSTPAQQTIGSHQVAGIQGKDSLSIYLMSNNNTIFKTVNYGSTWNLKGTLVENSWNRLDVSNNDESKVFAGGVNAMRSTNGGVTWGLVNLWSEYYGNISGKLHADIMNITNYRNSSGTGFIVINNHGGVAISYDNLTTTINLSESGLNSAQYYDILTALDNEDIIYGGAQDQGLQKTTNALSNAGPLNFTQMFSGDYGYLLLADKFKTLYAQYPGGALYLFDHNTDGYIQNWTMPGTQKPNSGWMLPAKNTYNITSDTILMAGGNINGGDGSFLCRIAMAQSAGYAINTSQYNYDFRANSANGSSGISAIETSPLQPERMYVATEDGTFFYSENSGSNWNRSSTFSVGGGWYLYGSTIVSSRLTKNLLWYGGSGYGSVNVFKSTDGGLTFQAMNNGLPQTLVHELVTNLDESMIFAATDAGPYVYVVSDNQWYPLIGTSTPIQNYTSVEYLSLTNTVRFGTYGRGIFDLKIVEPMVYYFFGNGNWSDPANWINSFTPPATLTGNNNIFVNPYGEAILNIPQMISQGAKIIIAPDRKITIIGNVNQK